MLKFWSEVPSARFREIAADVATWTWVSIWVVVAYRIYATISGFSVAGRVLREGGTNIQGAGLSLGGSLDGIPLVGDQVGGLTTRAFELAGEPFIFVGGELESLLILIARLLALLVAAVMIIPWLTKYLPWRASRLATLRAAHRVIRVAPRDLPDRAIDRTLASRALHRLSYEELLQETPDPIGDFAAGKFDRLARAELASVGLRPR